MSTGARIFVSTMAGLATAGVVAAVSFALGTAHVVPGCLVAFGGQALVVYARTGRRRPR